MEFFGVNFDVTILTLCLIAGDVVSGLMKAVATKTFSSSAMRQGLFHKAGTIMLLALAVGLTIAAGTIEEVPEILEFAGSGLYVGVNAYVILMELSSILENILSINPELDRYKIFELFGQREEKGEDEKDG